MWSKAFWKDAGERVLFTALATLAGITSADGFNWLNLDWKATAIAVLSVSFFTLVKALLAVLKNPNTGASAFGTTVPGELVSAYTTQKTIDGRSGTVLAHPGDTVAGPAATAITDGRQVEVVLPTGSKSPYTPPSVPAPPQD